MTLTNNSDSDAKTGTIIGGATIAGVVIGASIMSGLQKPSPSITPTGVDATSLVLTYGSNGTVSYENGSALVMPVDSPYVQGIVNSTPEMQALLQGKSITDYQAKFKLGSDRSLSMVLENKTNTSDAKETKVAQEKGAYAHLASTLGFDMVGLVPYDMLRPQTASLTDEQIQTGNPMSLELTGNYSKQIAKELGLPEMDGFRYMFSIGFDNKTKQLKGNVTLLDNDGNLAPDVLPANVSEEKIYSLFKTDIDGFNESVEQNLDIQGIDSSKYLDLYKSKQSAFYDGYETAMKIADMYSGEKDAIQADYDTLKAAWATFNTTHNVTWADFVTLKEMFVDIQEKWKYSNETQMANMTWTEFINATAQNYSQGFSNGWNDANATWQSYCQQLNATWSNNSAAWNNTNYQIGFNDGVLVGCKVNTTADLLSRNQTAFVAGFNDLLAKGKKNHTIASKQELQNITNNVTELQYLVDEWDTWGLSEMKFIDADDDAVYSGIIAGFDSTGKAPTRLGLPDDIVQKLLIELNL